MTRRAAATRNLLLGLLLLAPSAAEAGLSVTPSRTVIEGKPGQKLAGEYDVANAGEELIAAVVEPEDWAGGTGGGRGAVPWLDIKPKQFELKPGKSRKVKYTIRIPKDAHGELRAQVFFTSALEGGPRTRLGAILYVTIKDTARVEAAIGKIEAHYTASTPGIAQPDRLDVVLRLHNRSNVHVIPEGEIKVRDRRDRIVAEVPMPSGWGLLPNEEDVYHAIGTGVHLQPGTYTFEIKLRCGEDVRRPITLEKTVAAVLNDRFEFTVQDPKAPAP